MEVEEPAFVIPDLSKTQHHGMSLRDYFAAKAMESLILKLPILDRDGKFSSKYTQADIDATRADICESAYLYADAMLAERMKHSEKR